jgi:hypothetical protein
VIALSRSSGACHRDGRGRRQRADQTPRRGFNSLERLDHERQVFFSTPNFSRVETFGDNAANGLNDVHRVRALVDPQSRDVFAHENA